SEDMDLGWRARIAGYKALFVPDSVVLHAYQASTRRRTKKWWVVTTRTNRARTLVKNASVPFLLRTAGRSFKMFRHIVEYGGIESARDFAAAIWDSLRDRPRISAHARVARRDIERRWVKGAT